MNRTDMIEFIIKFGGVDNIKIRKQLCDKNFKELSELFNFTKWVSSILC